MFNTHNVPGKLHCWKPQQGGDVLQHVQMYKLLHVNAGKAVGVSCLGEYVVWS